MEFSLAKIWNFVIIPYKFIFIIKLTKETHTQSRKFIYKSIECIIALRLVYFK